MSEEIIIRKRHKEDPKFNLDIDLELSAIFLRGDAEDKHNLRKAQERVRLLNKKAAYIYSELSELAEKIDKLSKRVNRGKEKQDEFT